MSARINLADLRFEGADEADTLTFPSKPISGDTLDRVRLIGTDWTADEDWRRFKIAVLATADMFTGEVDPNKVREALTVDGELSIKPSRVGPFYSAASASKPSRKHPDRVPFLDFAHWGISADHKGGNAGKPAMFYRLRKATS